MRRRYANPGVHFLQPPRTRDSAAQPLTHAIPQKVPYHTIQCQPYLVLSNSRRRTNPCGLGSHTCRQIILNIKQRRTMPGSLLLYISSRTQQAPDTCYDSRSTYGNITNVCIHAQHANHSLLTGPEPCTQLHLLFTYTPNMVTRACSPRHWSDSKRPS
jgi:hypothetical protein